MILSISIYFGLAALTFRFMLLVSIQEQAIADRDDNAMWRLAAIHGSRSYAARLLMIWCATYPVILGWAYLNAQFGEETTS